MIGLPALATPSGDRLRDLADTHGLLIGPCAKSNFWDLEDAATYETVLSEEFNIFTPENQMKMEPIHPEQNTYDWTADQQVDFAETHNMKVHGHTLVWHNQQPSWFKNLPDSEKAAAMEDHVRTVVSHYQGRIYAWDVVNEWAKDWATRSGWLKTVLEDSWTWAHEEDPDALLILNDYRDFSKNMQMIEDLQAMGRPIDGFGWQMHIGENWNDPDGLRSKIREAEALGIGFYITELDITCDGPEDYDKQANVYQTILDVCLSEPACKAFQMWGFTDKYTWRGTSNHPLIFDENYDPKPAYYAIQDRLDDPPATATPTPDPNAMTLQAEDYDAMQGINNHGTGISYVDDGDWIRFDNVDLGSGYTTLRVRYARDGSNTGDRWAELRLGSTTGTEIARFYSDGTGGWSTYIEDTTSISGGSGVQTLYLVFEGGNAVGNFDWFSFEGGGSGPTPTPAPTHTPTPTPDPSGMTLQAEDYDAEDGINNHGSGISYVDNGDWIRFDNVDLGGGYTTLRVRYARDGSNSGDRWAELRLGSTSGTEIARFYSDGTGGWNTYIEDTTSVAGGSGVQTLYFVFRGGIAVGNFDWFRFEDGGGPTPTPTPTDTPTPTNTPVPTNTPTPTPTPSGELLTNPGFEQGTTDWSNFGGTSISAQSTYVHSGGQAVKVSNRNATWDGVQQDVTSQVQANGQGSYTLTAWFRLASGTYTAKVTVRLVADSTTYKGITCTANSTGWTECSGSTDLTWSGTLKSATFYLEIPGSSSVDFYGDDASLQKD
jgi:endo-1,4-beta-xylanase